MPKIKTHSGAKKRFKISASGKIKAKPACMQHNLGKRASKQKRSKRALMLLSKRDQKGLMKLLLRRS